MDDNAKLETVSEYLRLTYGGDTPNVNGLKALVQKVATEKGALDAVTITGDSFEGTSHHGELTLHPLLYLRAAMAVLREFDPTAALPQPPPRGALTDFRTTIVGT